jgi:isopentenyl-diphosphate delta-isomerase
MTSNNRIVSFDSEKLILVDEKDREIGYASKAECHEGEGKLHRAFSNFIFNSKRELLLQKRGAQKRLWPLYWSNSCCSHPRKGETNDIATQRRLEEELGFSTPLRYLYKFQYHARYRDIGSEYEVCSVYIGHWDGPVYPNPNEIAEWRFVTIEELEEELENHPEHFSPWFKMEWKRIREEFLPDIEELIRTARPAESP